MEVYLEKGEGREGGTQSERRKKLMQNATYKPWCSLHRHLNTEQIVTYYNNSAVLVTRCKHCKAEINRKIYRADSAPLTVR